MEVDPWLVETTAFYRRFGFFESPKTDEEVASWIVEQQRRRPSWSGFRHWLIHRDLQVLYFDLERLLHLDFESPSCSGDTMYEHEIPRLARITRGIFDPSDIVESGYVRGSTNPKTDKAHVTFKARGREWRYEFDGAGSDWIDRKLLEVVDEHLAHTPYRLHAPDDPRYDQSMILTVLDRRERDVIESERGFPLVPWYEYEMEP